MLPYFPEIRIFRCIENCPDNYPIIFFIHGVMNHVRKLLEHITADIIISYLIKRIVLLLFKTRLYLGMKPRTQSRQLSVIPIYSFLDIQKSLRFDLNL